MPRNITVFFSDGTAHQYNNEPDVLTPDDIEKRTKRDYPDKKIIRIDGGKKETNNDSRNIPQPIKRFKFTYEIHDILHVKKQGNLIIALKRISGYKKQPDLFTIHAYNLENGTGVNAGPGQGRLDYDEDMDGKDAYKNAKIQFDKPFIPGKEYRLFPDSSRGMTYNALLQL